jgi:hypothetical protein
MMDRPTEIGKWYGMEMNVENSKEIRISRPLPPAQIIIYQKRHNVEYFKYLGNMITNDTKSMREIKSGIGRAKAAFNNKFLHHHTGLKFEEETSEVLHLEHSFV